MAKSRIPGFEEVIHHGVYTRLGDPKVEGDVQPTDVLVFQRFTYPTPEKITNNIRESAEALIAGSESDKRLLFTSAFEGLPETIVASFAEKVAKRDRDLTRAIEGAAIGFCQRGGFVPTREMLRVTRGNLNQEVINNPRFQDLFKFGVVPYENVLNHEGSELINLQIALQKYCLTPKAQIMPLLSKRFAGYTDNFQVSASLASYDRVIDTVEKTYGLFRGPVSNYDSSAEYLNGVSKEILGEIGKVMGREMRKMMGGIELLGELQLLATMGGMPRKPRRR